jgi:hypothetical protein
VGSGGSIPFGVHQVVEMLLAAVLLLEGARTGQDTAVLVGLGVTLLLFALMSDGAVAAWPWIGRRAHRALDFAFAAALAVSPLVLSLDHVLPIVIVEAAAAGLVWLSLSTNWVPRERRRARRSAAAPLPDPPSDPPSEQRPDPVSNPLPPVAHPPPGPSAPSLARQLGESVGRAKVDGPRRLGRAVGRVRARSRRPPPA